MRKMRTSISEWCRSFRRRFCRRWISFRELKYHLPPLKVRQNAVKRLVQEKCARVCVCVPVPCAPRLTKTTRNKQRTTRVWGKTRRFLRVFVYPQTAATHATAGTSLADLFSFRPSRCCHNPERLRSPVPASERGVNGPPMTERAGLTGNVVSLNSRQSIFRG